MFDGIWQTLQILNSSLSGLADATDLKFKFVRFFDCCILQLSKDLFWSKLESQMIYEHEDNGVLVVAKGSDLLICFNFGCVTREFTLESALDLESYFLILRTDDLRFGGDYVIDTTPIIANGSMIIPSKTAIILTKDKSYQPEGSLLLKSPDEFLEAMA